MLMRLFASFFAKMREVGVRNNVNPTIFVGMQVGFGLTLLWGGAIISAKNPVLGLSMMTAHFSLVWGYVFILGKPTRGAKWFVTVLAVVMTYLQSRNIGLANALIVLVLTVMVIVMGKHVRGKFHA